MSGARQPIALVKANGKKHLTKKEIKDRESQELKVKNDKIVAPTFLSQTEKEIFYRISNELDNVGVMSNIDCNALARYIISHSNYEKMTDKMNSIDIYEDMSEYEKCVKMQSQFLEQCLKLEKEFGMTISSRCKIVAPKPKEEGNPLLKALSDG